MAFGICLDMQILIVALATMLPCYWLWLFRSLTMDYCSLFEMQNVIDDKKRQERRERLAFLANLNKMKCEACPIWGSDLINAVSAMTRVADHSSRSESNGGEVSDELPWAGSGQSYVGCLHAVEPMVGRRNFETLWLETNRLRQLVHTPDQYLDELKDIVQR